MLCVSHNVRASIQSCVPATDCCVVYDLTPGLPRKVFIITPLMSYKCDKLVLNVQKCTINDWDKI